MNKFKYHFYKNTDKFSIFYRVLVFIIILFLSMAPFFLFAAFYYSYSLIIFIFILLGLLLVFILAICLKLGLYTIGKCQSSISIASLNERLSLAYQFHKQLKKNKNLEVIALTVSLMALMTITTIILVYFVNN